MTYREYLAAVETETVASETEALLVFMSWKKKKHHADVLIICIRIRLFFKLLILILFENGILYSFDFSQSEALLEIPIMKRRLRLINISKTTIFEIKRLETK